jgi:hypothetical protein
MTSLNKIDNCHHCGEDKANCFYGHIAMTLPIPEAEALIDKWGRDNWWENLERTDLTDDEMKELEGLAMYDQMLNTIGRGIQCSDCNKKEAELYEKYYKTNK